ncbi:hypothetical protein GOV10_00865 [Candidatus Woesearchaeota archaeon]|nr:hypothetical protein [Candidatus Woesearchaeota archaeon]
MGEEKEPVEETQEEQPAEDAAFMQHIRAEKLFLSICIFATLFLALFVSNSTTSSPFFTFLGFLPLLITLIMLYLLVEHDYKQDLYWAPPFFTAFLFLAIMSLLSPAIDHQLNVGALTVINLILGLVVVLVLILFQGRVVMPVKEEFKEEDIGEYLHGIEDKCKALNFVIGRVYRMSSGGTDKMRSRVRINKDWYNEFHAIQSDDIKERKQEALEVLHKIHDRLMLYAKKENEIFSDAELKGLKNLVRDKEGNDKIIDVFLVNDRDPVEHYYVGAVDASRRLIAELEKP